MLMLVFVFSQQQKFIPTIHIPIQMRIIAAAAATIRTIIQQSSANPPI